MGKPIDEIKAVLSDSRSTLHGKRNVVATGIGFKMVNGIQTDEIGIVCSVTEKVEASALAAADVVPRQLDGVAVDVIQTGKIRAFQSPTGRFRPAPGGVSIGHVDITAGTLGCMVRRNGESVLLSNNHVLANSNAADKGDAILQPGPFDGGKFPADHIATLLDYVPIRFVGEQPTGCSAGRAVANFLNGLVKLYGSKTRFRAVQPLQEENRVDAAIARPLSPDDVESTILNIGPLAGTADAALGDSIKKMGRTTGLTLGMISQVEVTVDVAFGPDKTARFVEQYMAGAMSAGGDSGSAVLNDSDNLVGLLFAGSDTTTVMNPIEFVFSALNLSL